MKPQSMPVGERNVLRSNDSSSLWNCTLSPGWTQDEVGILRLALMKFGIGNWIKIVDSQCLIGKTIAQMNLQTQRMLGQQSTAEFAGLHIDPLVIGKMNSLKQGPDIKRKNNFIVNTGGKLSKEEKNKRLKENAKKYGLSQEEIDNVVLPTVKSAKMTIIDIETELKLLKDELILVQDKLDKFRTAHGLEEKLEKEPSEAAEIEAASENVTDSPLSALSSVESLTPLSSPNTFESPNPKKRTRQATFQEVPKIKAQYSSTSDSDVSIC